MTSTQTTTSEERPIEPTAVRKPTPVLLRTGLGIALLGAFALVLYLDAEWGAGYILVGAGALMVAAALEEFRRMAAGLGFPIARGFFLPAGVALFLLMWAGAAWPGRTGGPMLGLAALGLCLLGLCTMRVLRGDVDGALTDLGVHLLGFVFVPLMLGFLAVIRLEESGMRWVIAVIAVSKGGSAGAYFVGRHFGRTPLAPTVSPRKTVAGAVGAVAASLAVALVLSRTRWSLMAVPTALLFGAIVAASAMLGDLGMSLLKRQAGLKDSGGLLPGFGGMLDILDDILLTAPVAYLFLLGHRVLLSGG